MKLIQRIVVIYYRVKLKVLELVSPTQAAEAAFELFCTPYSRRKIYELSGKFAEAEKLSFELQHYKIKGFRWKSPKPNGLKILVCHGFDSSSSKFERYIDQLLQVGFEVLAFDAPAHGLSSGKTITAVVYCDMILHANAAYGPVNGIIAHSFGGIAAALAIEKLKTNFIQRLVLVAPATETTRSLEDFCKYLQLSNKLKEGIERLIVQIGVKPLSWYSVARVVQSVTIPTMWIHDKSDPITPFEDMEYLTHKNLPLVKFIITEGLGHSLYRNDAIAEQIIAFVSELKT
jgi:pimeloyl-ACP methyl ester carboxylesterase